MPCSSSDGMPTPLTYWKITANLSCIIIPFNVGENSPNCINNLRNKIQTIYGTQKINYWLNAHTNRSWVLSGRNILQTLWKHVNTRAYRFNWLVLVQINDQINQSHVLSLYAKDYVRGLRWCQLHNKRGESSMDANENISESYERCKIMFWLVNKSGTYLEDVDISNVFCCRRVS